MRPTPALAVLARPRRNARARQLAGVAPASAEAPFDAGEIERLRSLGYLR